MMKRNRKKSKAEKPFTHPKDIWIERTIYGVLFFLMIAGIVLAYLMSQEFGGIEMQENSILNK